MIRDDHDYEFWLMNGKVGRGGKEIHRLDYRFRHHCGSGHSSYAHSFRNPSCTPIQGMPPVTCKKCLARMENLTVPQEVTIKQWFTEGWQWRDVRVWYINWFERYPQPWRVYAIWEGHDVDPHSLSTELLWFEKTELVEKDGKKSYEWVGKGQHPGDQSYKWPVKGTDKLIVVPVNKDDGWVTRVGQHVEYEGQEMVIFRHVTETSKRDHGWDEPAWHLTLPPYWSDYQEKIGKSKKDWFAQPIYDPTTSIVLVESRVKLLKQL